MITVASRMISKLSHHRRLLHRKSTLLFLCLLMTALPLAAQTSGGSACMQQKIEAVRLPDLNIPRASSIAFFANGEVVLVGGHTNGFVPSATAEYLKDGKWHLVKTAYEHDDGLYVPLKSGKVLIGGGHEKSLGIGQTFPTEYYNPVEHSFEGFGCLDTKRALAQALELDSGKVVIAGNWYADDAVEMFDGKATFSHVKKLTLGFVSPYIFQISADNAVIFGSQDTHGKPIMTDSVYRLKGEPFSVPLFKDWHPCMPFNRPCASNSFVGNKQKGIYAYLFMVMNDEGQMAVAKMESTKGAEVPRFSLLPARQTIPMKSQWGSEIVYYGSVIVDDRAGKGYVIGFDKDCRYYVLCINNVRAEKDITLTLCYTEPLTDIGDGVPVLTGEGNIVVAGGITGSNFYPKSTAYMLCLGEKNEAQASGTGWLPWIVLTAMVLLAALLYVLLCRKRTEDNPAETPDCCDESEKHLFQRISTLMDNEKPYLRSDLKLSDVSALLSTNSRYVSEAIRNQCGSSFTQFVNGYRVEHAKRLMQENPDRKITEIAVLSGFSGESSFFRTFKTFTGLTPKEWIAHEQHS